METCVLLPPELSLVMCLPDSTTRGNIFDLGVTLWSNTHLDRGHVLDPEDGEAVLDTLECFTALSRSNVRFEYGCDEELVYVEGRKVRHCNWVRFLRGTDMRQQANLETRKCKGRTIYTVTKPIAPNDEICCYFQSSSPSRNVDADKTTQTLSKKRSKVDEDEDKENNMQAKSPQIGVQTTPIMKNKSRRRSQSMFYNTPVQKPLQECVSPEVKREAPGFTSPLSDYLGNKSISGVTNTSPSNASEATTDTSPGSLKAKEHSPISEASGEISPIRVSAPESNSNNSSPEQAHSIRQNNDEPMDYSQKSSKRNEYIQDSSEANDLSINNSIQSDTSPLTSSFMTSSNPVIHITPEEIPRYNIQAPHFPIASLPHPGYERSPENYALRAHHEPFTTPSTPISYRLPAQTRTSGDESTPFRKQSEYYAEHNDQSGFQPVRRREKTWLPCEMCGKKFDRPSLLKRHIRTHTGEKPHACDVCGKAFSTSSSLNTHRRIHSGEKPHQCQTCGKRFTASSNLYYHRMTHKKEKPHKCTLCSKSFPTPGDLRSHMYVHNGSWPFKCTVCNRGFSKQTNLKNHMLLHSGDRPHCCPICDKKFALQCNLKTHIKTHEEESESACLRCGYNLGENPTSSLCHRCQSTELPTVPSSVSAQNHPSYSLGSTPYGIPPSSITSKDQIERMHLYKSLPTDSSISAHYGRSPVHAAPIHHRNIMSEYMQTSQWTFKR